MPQQVNTTIKRAFIKWDMVRNGKHGLFLFIVLEDQAGNEETIRQCIFKQFFNPPEISDQIAGLIEQQFTTMLEIPVPPRLSSQILRYSTEEILDQMPTDPMPAGQFSREDLGIDPDEIK